MSETPDSSVISAILFPEPGIVILFPSTVPALVGFSPALVSVVASELKSGVA